MSESKSSAVNLKDLEALIYQKLSHNRTSMQMNMQEPNHYKKTNTIVSNLIFTLDILKFSKPQAAAMASSLETTYERMNALKNAAKRKNKADKSSVRSENAPKLDVKTTLDPNSFYEDHHTLQNSETTGSHSKPLSTHMSINPMPHKVNSNFQSTDHHDVVREDKIWGRKNPRTEEPDVHDIGFPANKKPKLNEPGKKNENPFVNNNESKQIKNNYNSIQSYFNTRPNQTNVDKTISSNSHNTNTAVNSHSNNAAVNNTSFQSGMNGHNNINSSVNNLRNNGNNFNNNDNHNFNNNPGNHTNGYKDLNNTSHVPNHISSSYPQRQANNQHPREYPYQSKTNESIISEDDDNNNGNSYSGFMTAKQKLKIDATKKQNSYDSFESNTGNHYNHKPGGNSYKPYNRNISSNIQESNDIFPSSNGAQYGNGANRDLIDKVHMSVFGKTLNVQGNQNKMNYNRNDNNDFYGGTASSNYNNDPNQQKALGLRKKFVPPYKAEGNNGNMQRNPSTQKSAAGGRNDNISPELAEKYQDERYKLLDLRMVEIIENEIVDRSPKITWNHIAGLEFAKKTIYEIIVWPMMRPDIFNGLRAPPRGLLLFGPPGTGKTMIGRAIASESNSTFFAISASTLTSKWVGEGEKMVKTLFEIAQIHQPSVIFIDEIDSLLCSRTENDIESSRRIKTEFLVQLEGTKTSNEDRILIIGATNRPQELDEAVKRRFTKRLYIPLPNSAARRELITTVVHQEISKGNRYKLTEEDISTIVEATKGYSGADMRNLCAEASMIPIRNITDISKVTSDNLRPTDLNDFLAAIKFVKATVSKKDLGGYLDWNKSFGSWEFHEQDLDN